MLKISCRLSRFLTKWSFRAKFFPTPGSKNVLSYYSYRTRFIKQKLFCIIVNAKQEKKVRPWRGKLEGSEEIPGGEAETVEKLKLNASSEAEGKITVQKTN